MAIFYLGKAFPERGDRLPTAVVADAGTVYTVGLYSGHRFAGYVVADTAGTFRAHAGDGTLVGTHGTRDAAAGHLADVAGPVVYG